MGQRALKEWLGDVAKAVSVDNMLTCIEWVPATIASEVLADPDRLRYEFAKFLLSGGKANLPLDQPIEGLRSE